MRSIFLELEIAYKFFRSKTKDRFISVISAFSVIGIILGVATLIVVMSVMNGYEKELVERISGIDGDIVITNFSNSQFDEIASDLRSNSYVEHYIKQIDGEGLLVGLGNVASPVSVRGLDAEDILSKKIIGDNIVYGSLDGYAQNGILIGPDLALKLGVDIGDTVRLVSPKGSQTLVGYIPKFKTFTISGIFDTGMYEHNLGTAFINSRNASLMFEKDIPDKIEIKLTHGGAILDKISSQLNNRLDGTSASILNKYQINNHLREALRVERVVMYLILTLIILVAAFNIISSLIILVKDKSKNIAILKTCGMDDASVCKIFMITGSIIGVLGSLIGGIIGIMFVLNIERIRSFLESITGLKLFDPVVYYLTHLPAQLEIFSVFYIILTALALTVLATFYPSFRASRLDPIVTLRNE